MDIKWEVIDWMMVKPIPLQFNVRVEGKINYVFYYQ